MTGTAQQSAIVTATFSRRMHVRLQDSVTVPARIRGRKLRPVCGDKVLVAPIPNEPEWLIESIETRQNELTRPDSRGRKEILAANLDALVVMAAAEPSADWFIVDRYLAAAETMGAAGMVVFNKIDARPPDRAAADELAVYESCDYPVFLCSAVDGTNLDRLVEALAGKTVIIVGQSGVGKSSVINRIVRDAEQRTADLSDSTGEGKHTTVNSIMLDLPGGGAVIDSPGVRDYAPAIESIDAVIRGFREIRKAGHQCRFANCRHLREPGCAVKESVDRGDISSRRYESYKRLVNISKDFLAKY
jgi:ribosome biogenesis GTPase